MVGGMWIVEGTMDFSFIVPDVRRTSSPSILVYDGLPVRRLWAYGADQRAIRFDNVRSSHEQDTHKNSQGLDLFS